jgi:hypothetical protein
MKRPDLAEFNRKSKNGRSLKEQYGEEKAQEIIRKNREGHMVKWEILGDLFGCSGYSIHVRSLFNALAKTEDVRLITGLIPNWQREINDKELEAIKKPEDYERIKIIVTHPVFWRVNCTNKYNICYLIWEGDSIPKSFLLECLNENIHKIVVASEHTKQAVLKTIESLSEEESAMLISKIK